MPKQSCIQKLSIRAQNILPGFITLVPELYSAVAVLVQYYISDIHNIINIIDIDQEKYWTQNTSLWDTS